MKKGRTNLDYLVSARSLVSKVTFHEAVWLFPPSFILHVLEEWPRFTSWAQRYASPLYSQQNYETIHIAGIIGSIVFATIVWMFPVRAVVFVFFAFVLAPGLFFNVLFHAGATVVTSEYCPGVITALTLYLPVFLLLCRLAWSENLLNAPTLISGLVIAGAFHTWEVGHNVFKAW